MKKQPVRIIPGETGFMVIEDTSGPTGFDGFKSKMWVFSTIREAAQFVLRHFGGADLDEPS